MSNQVTVRQPGGIGLPGALFIAFVVLKLTGVIDWSWLWVAAPIWIPVAFWLLFFTIAFIVILIAKAFYPRPRRVSARGRPKA